MNIPSSNPNQKLIFMMDILAINLKEHYNCVLLINIHLIKSEKRSSVT